MRLKETAAKLYPGSHVAAAWSAQDCITSDGIPFIGIYTSDRPNWYVATGFQKWGMSSSMVSALILKDLICNRENPFADVFSPSRFSAEEIPHIVKDGKKAVAGLTRRFFQIPDETISSLERGQGAVVTTSEGKWACIKQRKEKSGRLILSVLIWDVSCPGIRMNNPGTVLATVPALMLKEIFWMIQRRKEYNAVAYRSKSQKEYRNVLLFCYWL